MAENPPAVTWKEFDNFFQQWKAKPDASFAQEWLAEQAEEFGRTEAELYRDLAKCAVLRHAQSLKQADNAIASSDQPAAIAEARSVLKLLSLLLFDMGHANHQEYQMEVEGFSVFAETWAGLVSSGMPVHKEFMANHRDMIEKYVQAWGGDLGPVVRVLGLDVCYGRCPRAFDRSDAAREMGRRLCNVAHHKIARQALDSFVKDGNFVSRLVPPTTGPVVIGSLLWDRNGVVWTELRDQMIALLSQANSNRVTQINAYHMLRWFNLDLETGAASNRPMKADLLGDQAVFDVLWKAATASQLTPMAVYDIMKVPKGVERLGVRCELPPWWDDAVRPFTVQPLSAPDSPV